MRAILKEAASDHAHLSINNRSKFRRSIALHNHCGCVRGYVPQRRACVGLRRVASAGSSVGPLRITATSCRMRSQISPGQSSLVAAATSRPLTLPTHNPVDSPYRELQGICSEVFLTRLPLRPWGSVQGSPANEASGKRGSLHCHQCCSGSLLTICGRSESRRR